MSTFKISRIDKEFEVNLIDWEMPEIEKDEVKVKISSCGICTSDQGIYRGARGNRYPFFPGHEVVGIVEELGEHAQSVLKVGDKVVVSRMHKCWQCDYCLRGEDNLCINSKKLYRKGRPAGQGGMAEYLIVPSYQVFKLRDNADMLSSALLEPVACCVGSVKKGNVTLGDTVLVIGAGIMGLLHAELLKLLGARVIISEIDEDRRLKAKEVSDIVINPLDDLTKQVMEITDGLGVKSVYVTAGGPNLVPESFKYIAKKATIVIYTSYYNPEGPEAAIDMNTLHYNEYDIVGTISPSNKDWKNAIDLVMNNQINLNKYVTETFKLDDVKEAFDRSLENDVYRVVLTMR